MTRLQHLSMILLFTLFLGCDKDGDTPEVPSTAKFLFEDGFETQANTLDELFPSDNTRWSTLQQTDPANATNEIAVSTTEFSEGEGALRIVAYPSDSQLSKMDIEKNGLSMQAGDRVTIKADFFISGTEPLTNLLLIDLECCSCWDPNVGDNYGSENQCPGVRLMMSGERDYLGIERGKISGTTLQQTALAFPRNRWVTVEWEMTLSDNETGQNKLTIDGEVVIDQTAMNLPNPEIFRQVFANQGIDFTLQQPTFYERVQVGATANPTAGRVEMFVDNFSLKVE